MPDSHILMPEHLTLMNEEQRWDGLIRLLQSYRDEISAMKAEIAGVRFEQEKMNMELADMREELQTAEAKLGEIDKLRMMAMGGKAVLVAGGAAALWLLNHAFDFVSNRK